MEVGQQIRTGAQILRPSTALLLTGLAGLLTVLVLLIEFHHTSTGEVQTVHGRQEGQQADLDHLVVQDLIFSGRLCGITILELSPDGTVTSSDGHTAGEHTTGLQNDVGPHPRQSSINQCWRCRSDVFVGVLVDTRVAGQHIDMGDLEVIEQQETVVHGAKQELV